MIEMRGREQELRRGERERRDRGGEWRKKEEEGREIQR